MKTQKLGKLEHATRVVALCLPPVVMSLIGLAALAGRVVRQGRASHPRLFGRPRDEPAPDDALHADALTDGLDALEPIIEARSRGAVQESPVVGFCRARYPRVHR